MSAHTIKASHPAIKAYHAALKTYAEHHAAHEGATETAFSRLVADTAKSVGWTLIPKQSMTIGKKTIYPDGTLRDAYNLPRGYWEAKDTSDDLKRRDQEEDRQEVPADEHDLRGHADRRPVPAQRPSDGRVRPDRAAASRRFVERVLCVR